MTAAVLGAFQNMEAATIASKFIDVTPEMAREWLAKNTHNRKLMPSLVARYVADMTTGRWRVTHQGIAFDTLGRLLDGQHRLAAIVESGVTVRMLVTFGIEPKAQLVVDDQKVRSLADNMALTNPELGLTKAHEAIARVMWRGMRAVGSHTTISKSGLADFILENVGAIFFAVNLLPAKKRGVTQAPVLAVLARAYFTADRTKLGRFALILSQDDNAAAEQHELAAVSLKNFLKDAAPALGGSSRQRAVYAKTERALWSFLRGESLKRVYEANKELFPLPGEAN